MLRTVHGVDWVWNSAMECRCKPQWHALLPPTRFLRERLFDWAGSREFDIVRKAQTFTQAELEDYYVDVVETQVREQLGHSLRTKDSVFLRFAIALRLEQAAACIPYTLTFTRCLRLYKKHDGHKLQDCEWIAADAWSRVGWRTPFSHRPKQKKKKTNWELFERCSEHSPAGTSDAEIDYCVDCKYSYALYMENPEKNRRIALSKARAVRVDDLMEESVSSDNDEEDEDVQFSGMLRQREAADLNNEEYSQLELGSYMMSDEAHHAQVESLKRERIERPPIEDDADDESEEEDNEGDILVVPAKQQVKPSANEKTSPRYASRSMNISSMIQQKLVDDCSDEEVKRRRRERRQKKSQIREPEPDLEGLTDGEKMRISMDRANAAMHEWRLKRGENGSKKEEKARKRKAENIRALIQMGLVSEVKRVRFAL